jgi:eukaryotic-like serine/threonine-protein kinase
MVEGQTVGKYRVVERVGRGGMGIVYRAVDETLSREVAIKSLNPEVNEPDVARRFRAEAVTVARLNHPGIATVYELFQHEDHWLMVMEFVRGETLEALIERVGALPVERVVDLASQALAALAHAHSLGVVHRDLKPANLMLNDSGVVKIMDFGIARVIGSEHLTTAGFMMGTPAYMAPEQVLGQEIDSRADLYAMGVVLYRLATGKLPFKGATPFAMAHSQVQDPPTPVRLSREGLPAWIEQVIGRALAKRPEERFQTAQAFADAIRTGAAGVPLDLGAPPLATLAVPATLDDDLATGILPQATLSPRPEPVLPDDAGAPAPSAPASSRTLRRAAALAGLLVVVAAAAAMWHRASPAAQPPAPVEAAGSPAAAPQASGDVPQPPEPPAAPAPQAQVSPSASASGSVAPATGARSIDALHPPDAAARPPVPTAVPPTPASAAAGAPGAGDRTARPATNDPLLAFGDVKLLTVDGHEGREQDVVLNLAGGQLSVVPKKGGAALQVLPYAQIARVTYVNGRKPQWHPAAASPPSDLDVPGGFLGMGGGARQWLTLQTRTTYVILRLHNNQREILQAIESRAGLKVDSRPAED